METALLIAGVIGALWLVAKFWHIIATVGFWLILLFILVSVVKCMWRAA